MLESLTEAKDEFVLADEWDDELANSAKPYIELYYKQEAMAFRARVGAEADFWHVVNPKLNEAIDRASLKFAQSTNETTSMELSDALDKLREELRHGLLSGDPVRELTNRVQEVFDRAETTRAMTIASTEASRAVHTAQIISGEATGLVVGWKWLLSEDACPVCIAIEEANPVIPLGGTFAVIGKGEYSQIKNPPAHPNCMCAMTEILDSDAEASLVTGGKGSKSGGAAAAVPLEVNA